MDLRHNPFYILGASMTDNKRRIMELAEEKSLFGDEEAVEEAKTILLDPIRRIDAELSWFPELDAETARAMALYLVESQPMPSCSLSGVGRITESAEIMSRTEYEACPNKAEFANNILALARGFRDLKYDALQETLNQSRRKAGFSEITDEYLIADKIDNRRLEVIKIIQHCMDSISIEKLLRTFYLIAHYDTDDGKLQASILVEDIIRFYESNMMTQEFMENETNAIRDLLDSIKQAVSRNDQNFTYAMNLAKALIGELQKWQNVVAPMQIVAVSHGKEHTISAKLLHDIRSVAIDLNNDFNRPELSLELLDSIEKVAADKHIPSFHEVKIKDRSALDKILSNRKEEKEAEQEYENSIFYEAKIGLFFTDNFQLSTKGITWNNKFYKLSDITRIRWGVFRSVKKNILGGVISEHTEYTICFGTKNDCVIFNPDASQYRAITNRLWKAVGSTILFNYINRLKSGKSIIIKNAVIYDNGIELEKHNYFSANERKFFEWKDISVANGNGYFVIMSRNSNDFKVELFYIDDDNTHVVETMIRSLFKKFNRNNPRISSLVDNRATESPAVITNNQKAKPSRGSAAPEATLQYTLNKLKGIWYDENGVIKLQIDNNSINGQIVNKLSDIAGSVWQGVGNFHVTNNKTNRIIHMRWHMNKDGHSIIEYDNQYTLFKSPIPDYFESVRGTYLGMTKQQLLQKMGEPNKRSMEPKERWEYDGIEFGFALQVICTIKLLKEGDYNLDRSGLSAASDTRDFMKAYGLQKCPSWPNKPWAVELCSIGHGEYIWFGFRCKYIMLSIYSF